MCSILNYLQTQLLALAKFCFFQFSKTIKQIIKNDIWFWLFHPSVIVQIRHVQLNSLNLIQHNMNECMYTMLRGGGGGLWFLGPNNHILEMQTGKLALDQLICSLPNLIAKWLNKRPGKPSWWHERWLGKQHLCVSPRDVITHLLGYSRLDTLNTWKSKRQRLLNLRTFYGSASFIELSWTTKMF